MSARVLVGTASWADRALIESGRFYPPEAKSAEARLRYYASQFPLVEADTTYYGLPTTDMARAWVDRTPEGFVFDIKSYSLFTEHPTATNRLPKAIKEVLPLDLAKARNIYRKDTPAEIVGLCWSTFIDGIWPLHEADKLGVVMFQFPPWVFPNRATKTYLEEIRERIGPFRAAVEFRNDIWLNAESREEIVTLLGDLDFSYVCVDEPQGFKSSVPPIALATNSRGIVRFHGRNAETWEQRTRTSAERFDWWYSQNEFDEWVTKIRALAGETDEMQLLMNTNNENQGPANAVLLRDTLASAGMDVVGVPAGD